MQIAARISVDRSTDRNEENRKQKGLNHSHFVKTP